MSEYFENIDFATLLGTDDQDFGLSFLDSSNPIGQDEVVGDGHNATFDFDPGMDFVIDPALNFDFNASLPLGLPLPVLSDATTTFDQSPYGSEGGSLRLGQQHWSADFNGRSNETNTHMCRVCHKWFYSIWQLNLHCVAKKHASWSCVQPGCSSRFYIRRDLHKHQSTPHVRGHHVVWDDTAITCAECNEIFRNEIELKDHAKNNKHSSYTCSCEAKFARPDVLHRHIKNFAKESAKYECKFCKRYRGKQAFRRRDHLVQHMQGYHKMEPEEINDVTPPAVRVRSRQILTCPHVDCEAYRDDAFKALPWIRQSEGKPFQKQSDYNKHMREVHQESTFPCPVAGCDRVGVKGYMREKDLIKHLADKHPEAPSYSYVPPKPLLYQCEVCNMAFTATSSLDEHRRFPERCRKLRMELNMPVIAVSG